MSMQCLLVALWAFMCFVSSGTTALRLPWNAARSANAAHTRATPYSVQAEADRVHALPGAPDLDFGLFSGYVTVDEEAGRALFYIFSESKTAPAQAPLVLWLNGGPGCSSIGGGFMSELGPFYPKQGGQGLKENPYAWNNIANVLWLESPAFVGFSYSNETKDAIVGDARTARDARAFLLGWLERFPQYATAELYIAGESYGGHYVPQLAWEIWKGNKPPSKAPAPATAPAGAAAMAAAAAAAAGDKGASGAQLDNAAAGPKEGLGFSSEEGFINLKGILVGNAWTDPSIDNKGALDFWYTHAMISDESYLGMTALCDFATIGPLFRGREALLLPGTHQQQQQQGRGVNATAASAAAAGGGSSSSSRMRRAAAGAAARATATAAAAAEAGGGAPSCEDWLEQASSEQGSINIYEIYADVCPDQLTPNSPPTSAAAAATATPDRGHLQGRYRGALLGYQRCSSSRPLLAADAPTPNQPGGLGGPPPPKGPSGWLGFLRGLAPSSWAAGAKGLAQGGAKGFSSGGEGAPHPGRPPRYDPCVDDEVGIYMNLPEVQAALHANQTVKLPGPWTDCTSAILYSRQDLLTSVLPTWHKLLGTGLKLWVFSGDVDGIVPVLGSRRWVEYLQLPLVKPWRPWVSSTGQVGGWRVDYKGLTFATVRNAGHMVPYVQPERAFHLLGKFLFGGEAGPPAAAPASHS